MDFFELYVILREFTSWSKEAKYPPYHMGDTLENYFIKYYIKNINSFKDWTLIPIIWTDLFNNKTNRLDYVEKFINKLPAKKYFCMCTHDDFTIKTKNNLTIFSGGGPLTTYQNNHHLPVPLVCSEVPDYLIENRVRDIFCSFYGSDTHPIRKKLFLKLSRNKDFVISLKKWVPNVNELDMRKCFDLMNRSVFTLCPRGYGITSYRLYECLQTGTIPVYVSDRHWLPFSDKINWNDFCVIVNEHDNVERVLYEIPKPKQEKMVFEGKRVWKNFFTYDRICEEITNILTLSF